MELLRKPYPSLEEVERIKEAIDYITDETD